MLDLRYLEENPSEFKERLAKRGVGPDVVARLADAGGARRALLKEVESKKALRNAASQEIAKLKARAKQDPAAAKLAEEEVLRMRAVGDEISSLDAKLKELEETLNRDLASVPNLPHASVPPGKGAEENVEVKKWGTPVTLPFPAKDHVALGEALGILDFERASKISGARFSVYLGAGASLERALIQFMLDLHTREHGYQEVIPPFMVNRESMMGTGQLPKFEEDLFKTAVADRDLFLIPTSEVPLTNLRRDELMEGSVLPLYYTAYSPCFRSEAGSYGKDTRGLIRQHQFQKVELVKIVRPESSYEELEKMTRNAEAVLERLGLPYRTMLLCSGDMGFSGAKTYDLEVWLPAQNSYREISSCSNCEDFQARRAQIRFREDVKAKPRLAHTLNGSGLAVGRTFVAILENFQNEAGEVKIPRVLNRYLDGAPGFVKRGEDLWIAK